MIGARLLVLGFAALALVLNLVMVAIAVLSELAR